ncbi:peptidoglycan DD-metalloendopeptidase family protein [candidate division KSB1 bacterium]|nr:peptidoglycan DD-metalloendopeptidase family protein [candidate division KSB1 bacterium]NIR68673.1 peptidoglycan DD-metalloendopeptidase family protein [candidate division KSB1 bacterium]NIS27162.1 peptidoglycan DD-metalloendopeptidase family protein [candidate division KSB1 bacterium]NIT74048.1 peptidoglycan DD-metalloendopeptidase family protein [candidate division KSB1 bacterium]NIU27914.1 peptidoglycan DD-metalloendopeptidase family protein [candidate division KSB1 bacterium]
MHAKKVKIIYFSVIDSNAKQLELTWGKFLTLLFTSFLILLFLVSVTIALFTDFYQNMALASLSKLNKLLKVQLSDMGEKIQQIDSQIKKLENVDDDLRIIADLPKIDPDTRNVGVGGFLPINYTSIPVGSDELSQQVFTYGQVLDKMERRIELTRASRNEIAEKIYEHENVMRHTPSIRPLMDGRITDKFGMRLHPILDKMYRHAGIDISAERGTEVFASAAGVVKGVVTSYKLNQGYGKYVMIDHGFGIETLYGHLSKVLVRKGQKVNRWDAIGLVGDSGLATGPHLHYEVKKNGKQLDPMQFILNTE